MNVDSYLNRLKFSGNLKADLNILNELHQAHLFTIPFENLDIHEGISIILEENHLSDKILTGNRGGYCYELNGMFSLLLQELGFNVKMISARVKSESDGWGPEFDHLALLVSLDRIYIADVGFGDNFILPKVLDLNVIQYDSSGYYKIERFDKKYFILMKSNDGNIFSGEYIFTLKERKWNEFEGMNNFHQTSRKSHFTKNKICSKLTEYGRITLTDKNLIITKNGIKNISGVSDGNDFKDKLLTYFNIRL